MKRFVSMILPVVLTMVVSSSALGGHIAGGRASGNIAGGRIAGNIAGGRASGHIAGGRTATFQSPSIINPDVTNGSTRVDIATAMSGTWAVLIRMLLESGAVL